MPASAQGCTCWLCNCNDFAAPPLPPAADTTAHSLRVFVDKSVIEAFAEGGSSTVTGRVYPAGVGSTGISLFWSGEGDSPQVDLSVWGMGNAMVPLLD